MKKLLVSFFIFLNGLIYSQHSNYYNVNSNSNVNVNANVNHNVSGVVYQHSTQTINTIDYGALALANAQKEQNQIELQKIANANKKRILEEIILDPVKAYDYGKWQGFISSDKKVFDKKVIQEIKEMTGLKSFRFNYLFPEYFFNKLSEYDWQNVSKDGVITEIFFFLPTYNKENKDIDHESNFENDTVAVGKEIELMGDNGKPKKIFFHKKELNLATVFCGNGYKSTFIWEDKFENGITDNYMVLFNNKLGNGVEILVKVRYHGDKDDVTFEQLEGRRYYLKGLIEKIISNAKVSDIVLLKD